MEQTPFDPGRIGFAENPENRCPSVLILDVSRSMEGEPLKELQAGLSLYRNELAADALTRKRVEVAILTFGGSVRVVQEFVTVDRFAPPVLVAHGDTPMGQAVVTGLNLLADRKGEYRGNGILFYRPWVFLITDGAPTDLSSPYWAEAKALVTEGERAKKFSFFAIGVEGADFGRLAELSVGRKPLKLRGVRFRDLFRWLSNSQQAVSRSIPGESVPLANPAAPEGWAEV